MSRANAYIFGMLTISSLLFFSTLSRDIYWKDSAEFSGVALELGIPHPPGHPVFPLLARSLMGVGISTHLAVNGVSALGGALTVTVLFILLLAAARSDCGGEGFAGVPGLGGAMAGALFLISSPILRKFSAHAEVYSLLSFFSILMLLIYWMYRKGRQDGSALLTFLAFLSGLSLGNNYLIIFISIPVFLTSAVSMRRSLPGLRRSCALPALFFLLGLSVFLYLPLRSSLDPLYNWGDPRNIRMFADVLTVREFSANLFALQYSASADFEKLLGDLITLPALPISIAVTCLSLVGSVFLFRRDAPFATSVLAAWVISLSYAFLCGGGIDFEGYLIVPVTLTALLFGCGVSSLPEILPFLSPRRTSTAVIQGILILAIVGRGLSTFDEANLRNRSGARAYAAELAGDLPRGAVLFTGNTVDYFLVNFLIVSGERGDLACVHTPLLRQDWYRQILLRRVAWSIPAPEPVGVEGGDDPATSLDRIHEWMHSLRERGLLYYTPGTGYYFSPKELDHHGFVFRVNPRNDGGDSQPVNANGEDIHARLFDRLSSLLDGDRNTIRRVSVFLSTRGFYYGTDRPEIACRYYRMALDLDRRNASILYNLGNISLTLGDYDSALDYFDNALALDGRQHYAIRGKGRVHLATGRFGSAVEAFEDYLSRHPGDPPSMFDLAQCYFRRGETTSACGILKDLLALRPDDLTAMSNLGVCYLHLGETERAIEQFNAVVAADSSVTEAYHNLSIAYSRIGDLEGAARCLELAGRFTSPRARGAGE